MWIRDINAQKQELPRTTLLKNKISEVKIYNLKISETKDSIFALESHYFINDSGNIVKEMQFYLNEDQEDSSTEIFTYDSLNRLTSNRYRSYQGAYYIKYEYHNKNEWTITHYLNSHDSDAKTVKAIEKNRKRVYKHYYQGILCYKDVWQKKDNYWTSQIIISKKNFLCLLAPTKTIQYLDPNKNIIKIITYQHGRDNYTIKEYTYNNLNECIIEHYVLKEDILEFPTEEEYLYYKYIKRED